METSFICGWCFGHRSRPGLAILLPCLLLGTLELSVTNLSPPSLNTRTLSVLSPLGIQHSAGTEQRDSEGVPGSRYWDPSPEGPRDPPGLWAWPLPIQRPAWPPPLAEATSNEDTGKGPEVSVQGAECVHRDARLTFCLCSCWGVTPTSHATHGCSSGLCDTREASGVLMVFYMMGVTAKHSTILPDPQRGTVPGC